MNYFVYILQSQRSGKYYCGQTNNVSDRLQRHNKGEKNCAQRTGRRQTGGSGRRRNGDGKTRYGVA
ncbi:MAG: GIY-YIG nuclease family protein [Marinilabiliaceae bacterium]|nr:GIY-YIG nuclease family protein [Marinilabiliaceae bacterium]